VKEGNKILITCREATRLEEIREESKIAFSGRFALWVHLLYCKFCRLFIKQSALLEKSTRDMAYADKSYSLTSERKEIMKKALESD